MIQFPIQNRDRTRLLGAAILLAYLVMPQPLFAAPAIQISGLIEGLSPPTPATPPVIDEDKQSDQDLRRMRSRRKRKKAEETPAPPSYTESLAKALDREAEVPHPKKFFLELALLFTSASTTASRQGYTSEPTVHFNAAWQMTNEKSQAKDTAKLWLGVRAAPFFGNGFYHSHPGGYGLTYFGPMIGVGKIDPLPSESASSKPGEVAGNRAEKTRASSEGWLLSGGIAAVSRQGRSVWPQDPSSDFLTKGVGLDVPGVWLEIRNMHVVLGAVGINLLAGVQTGKDKAFFYTGIGIAGWD